MLSAFPVPQCEEKACSSISVDPDVICVKTQQSCEPWHHSGIWQFAKIDARLRSPASLESSTPLRRRLASHVCGSRSKAPRFGAIEAPISRSGIQCASLKSETCRNADILSTSGRLPDPHRAIPNYAVADAAENTEFSHWGLDWNATCFMRAGPTPRCQASRRSRLNRKEILCGLFDSHYGGPTPSW
jgi:hypothetical protein